MHHGRTRPAAESKSRQRLKRCAMPGQSRSTSFASLQALLANLTNSFIELYNAGSQSVDISNWTLTEHPARQAIFSTVKIPAGTKLAASGFYLLGLSNSGLAAPARRGRQHPPCQEHGWNVDWRYHHHRYRLQHGNAQDRKPGDGCHQPHNAVATSSRRTGDHNSCRLDQCACRECIRLRCRPEDRAWGMVLPTRSPPILWSSTR